MVFDAPTPEEFAFIFDSWARSFRKSPWAGCIPNHLYDTVSRECAKGIIDRPTARVVVALPSADIRRVMGYYVAEPERGVLHWLYVKDSFRRMGVGKALLEHAYHEFPSDGTPWTYTFRTRASEPFLRRPRPWRWDPVAARVK